MSASATVAVVLGTYNRRDLLGDAIRSIRKRAGIDHHFIVIDGGSTDGSRQWLAEQEDVTLIGQRGPLTGAVRAFNLGFRHAVEQEHPFVFHFNDDALLQTEDGLRKAVDVLRKDPDLGAVAFEFNLRGPWQVERIHCHWVYPNFGLVRLEAGMAVARAQGDLRGHDWWNPIYRTYGADSEFGCWLHKLGWGVHIGEGLRVEDRNCKDDLRHHNLGEDPNRPDSKLFWSRWPRKANIINKKLPPHPVA